MANTWRFAITAGILLRDDFDGSALRRLARQSHNAGQTRRLLALAEIYGGGSRPDAARIGGVGVPIVRDWVVRFNAKGPDGLLNGKAPGAPRILDDSQRQVLRQVGEDGPLPAIHGVVRWRPIDLARWLFEEFRLEISKQTLSRELRNMGTRQALSAAAPSRARRGSRRGYRGGNRRERGLRQEDRALVPGRSPRRAKEQHHAAGPSVEHAPPRRMISGRHRPISSAPSVRPMEKAPGSSSPPATARPWRFIWKNSRLRSRPARMRSFFSIRRDGMSRRGFLSQTTSPSCRCRRNRLSSTRWKISGSSCATTGSPTGSSNLMTTSSITVALPGTSSSTCRGKSSPSGPETGSTGHDHQDLVLLSINLFLRWL